jgi:Holliday junction resolvase RusA-like endonuclease
MSLREIAFILNEKPIAQKRHRHTKAGVTYDPCKKDKLYYRILIKRATEKYSSLKEHLLCGPLAIQIKFYFSLPKTKSLRKKKGLYHISKPDCDNLQKFILDCCSGLLYADDAYIFKISAIKCYTHRYARTEVTVTEVLQEPILETKHGTQQTFLPARTKGISD